MNDNWLQDELKREAKLSVWDFDDRASYLDEEHRKHCEARELREHHAVRHEQPLHQTNRSEFKPNISNKQLKTLLGIVLGSLFTFIFLVLIITLSTTSSHFVGDFVSIFIEFIVILCFVYLGFKSKRK